MKIVKYSIATEESPDLLEKLVQDMIEDDWQPLGGISMSIAESPVEYAQAMVKYG